MRNVFSLFSVAYLTVAMAIGPRAQAQPLAPKPAAGAEAGTDSTGGKAVTDAVKRATRVLNQASFRKKAAPEDVRPPAPAAPVKPAAVRPAVPVKASNVRPPPGRAPGAAAMGGGAPGSAAGAVIGTTPPGASNAAVVELPGEKLFNSCMKMPSGKRVVKLNLKPDTEIGDLINWISTITCAQFLVPGGVSVAGKKVTIIAPQLITPEEAYRLFLAALESTALTIEPIGKFMRIVDTNRARYTNLPFYRADEKAPTDKSYITRMVRLQYLDPTEVTTNVLNRIKGESGDIVTVAPNGLIITDQAVVIERLIEVLKEIDVAPLATDKIWMVRVTNTSATEMAGRLAEIFQIQQIGTGGRRGPGGQPMAAPPLAPAAAAAKLLKPPGQDLMSQMTISKLIPDERSNHLIVIANERAYDWLVTMIKRLDQPIEGGGDGRVHVYYCENANCDELAATLSAVAGISVVGGGSSASRRARTGGAGQPPPPAPIAAPNAGGQGQQGQVQLFEGEVRVTFDGPTNALLVVSSLKDFQALRKVIERLDAPRKQVFVEALILEVLLDKTRKVGTGYHAGLPVSVGGKDSIFLGGFDAKRTLNPSALVADPGLAGLAGALFGPAVDATKTRIFGVNAEIPSFGAFLYFLQENNDVNVLSSPHLLITNNQEGEISVGENLPFPGSFLGGGLGGLGGLAGGGVGGGLGGFGTSVQRQDVALKMKLIPSVNEHNMIRLDVDQEVSDVSSPNFNGLGPATSKRTAKTQVFCRDQQTVVIGGLMTDRASEVVKKVPILGDIPILGFFFRNTEKTIKKSNIIIALTPYVISDMADLRRVADKKMRERREFLDRFSSIEDNANLEATIDYRRKRGMLEEINRSAVEIEDEEAELQQIRERDAQEQSTPIEPPKRVKSGSKPAAQAMPAEPPPAVAVKSPPN